MPRSAARGEFTAQQRWILLLCDRNECHHARVQRTQLAGIHAQLLHHDAGNLLGGSAERAALSGQLNRERPLVRRVPGT